MKVISTRILSIIMLLALLLVFSACSNEVKQDPPASSSNNSGANTQTGSNEKVDIVYWILGGQSGLREKYYQETVDEFIKQNPNVNITVELELGNQTERAQKLYTMLVSGSGPDVFHCNGMHIHDYATNNLIYALDGMPGIEEAKANFYDACIADASQDGVLYALPIRSNSVELFYNKDHFKEVGLDPERPPRTWDEFREYSIKLTKRDENGNVTRYGSYPGFFADLQQTVHYWNSMFFPAGGEFVTDGKVTFNSEVGIKSVEYWNDLINVLGVSPSEEIKAGFETGKYSMRVQGEWEIVTFQRDYPDLNFGFAPMPSWSEDQKPLVGLGGQYLAIPAHSKNVDTALKFILFSTSKEEQMRYVSNKIGTSGRKDILDDPFFTDDPGGPMYMTAIKDLANTKLEYAPNIVEMNTLLGNAIHSVILDERDAKEALDEAAEKYQKVYDQAVGK